MYAERIGFGKRLVGFFIDVVICGVTAAVILFFLIFTQTIKLSSYYPSDFEQRLVRLEEELEDIVKRNLEPGQADLLAEALIEEFGEYYGFNEPSPELVFRLLSGNLHEMVDQSFRRIRSRYELDIEAGALEDIQNKMHQLINELELENISPIAIRIMLSVLVIPAIIILLYFLISEVFLSASIGKLVFSARIRLQDGDASHIVGRTARFILKNAYVLLVFLSGITLSTAVFIVGLVAAFLVAVGFFFTLSHDKQALHDLFSKTAVYSL